ncbi:MAG: hypothetical protein KJO38_02185, partial [Gammaproteobacteria bacterium]|nr:hypothetical protein [Gammaproteobacteria bacterium]
MSNDFADDVAPAMAAPDFAARLARHPGPDDRPWWQLWVSAYAVPALYTAWRVGLITACGQRACSIEDIAERCELSQRTARILLHLLTSRKLLHAADDRFRATPAAARRFSAEGESGPWARWLAGYYDNPVTPDRLTRWLAGNADVTFPALPDDAGAAEQALETAAWGFPAAVVADGLGLFALLAGSAGAPLTVDAALEQLAPGAAAPLAPARLATLLQRLETAGVLRRPAGPEQLSLLSPFDHFL